jgi:hypothetical protein
MTTDDADELTDVDRDALARALALVRASKDPGRRVQIEGKLREEGWFEAASFAAYSVQNRVLGLKPWQDPPCFGHLGDDPAAAELQRRLEAAGLSIFEPDPEGALAAREAGAPTLQT